ncbi:MAG: helix-turn-helix domain-containing protein [Thermodesulfobacteriota bacterium]
MAQDSPTNRPKINDPADIDSAHSLGSYLQRERLKKQFSLEEVAEQTCINLGTLQAIENNDRSKMPAEVFSRGFIKLYAKFLGLDQQEVLERYEREMAQSEEENIRNHDVFYNEKLAESSSFLSLRKIVFLLILFALIALGYYLFLYSESPSYRHSSFSLGSGNLSSQINEKFEAVQTTPPAQTQYPAPAGGGAYPSATSPAAGQPPADATGGQNPPTSSYTTNEQALPPAVSPQAGDPSPATPFPASGEKQDTPPPAR